jgi:hypothetical protein
LAAASIKLKDWSDAKKYATNVLEIDENNVKVFIKINIGPFQKRSCFKQLG